MEHERVIETMEFAALEAGGLDRLMAGDTATSQAVAAHVAGCASCGAELAMIERDARVIADVVATTPSADLRDRTLATVRERGVQRGAIEPAVDKAAPPPAPIVGPGRRVTLGWVAAIAAAVVLSVGLTSAVMGDRAQDRSAAQSAAIDTLRSVAKATITVASRPDATSVDLVGTADPTQSGSLVFSPSSTEVVVVASGLTEPPVDQEYSCWVDAGSGRVRIGKMYFGGGYAYWVGESAALAGLDSPATFGVSLVDAGVPAKGSEPVLIGRS